MIPSGLTHWRLIREEEFQLILPGPLGPSTTAELVSYEMLYNASFTFSGAGIACAPLPRIPENIYLHPRALDRLISSAIHLFVIRE